MPDLKELLERLEKACPDSFQDLTDFIERHIENTVKLNMLLGAIPKLIAQQTGEDEREIVDIIPNILSCGTPDEVCEVINKWVKNDKVNNKEMGNLKLPKDEKSLIELVERGQHVKGFVIYCQLITEKIDNHTFCEKCPFHLVHMKTRIPIICTSDKKFIYTKKGQQIVMSAKGVESVEFPNQKRR